MVRDTSSLECKCCEESERKDGEADDKWACGCCEEDGVDEVGHLGRSISGVCWKSVYGIARLDLEGRSLEGVLLDASKDEEDIGDT